MPASRVSKAPLIKGYLPVRLRLPNEEGDELVDTFFFVKEHFGGDKMTLFVSNIPVIPGVSARVVLQSMFGRYGDIDRITVIENPRKKQAAESESLEWTTKREFFPSFHGPIYGTEKFAHVTFASSTDMKKALKALQDIMAGKSKDHGQLPGLLMARLEQQTLVEETSRQEVESDDDQEDTEGVISKAQLTGIKAVADRYRTSCSNLSRERLLQECNSVMEQFEDAEEADRRAREAAKNQPDEDGFVTVTYSTQAVGSKRDLEQGVTTTNRRKGSKRTRKKKDINGASELKDFYRFQMKETRKKNLQELRKRFEKDLARVKKLKDERQYRPF